MTTGKEDEAPARALFLPSRRAWILFAALGLASLGTALFLIHAKDPRQPQVLDANDH